MLYAYPETRGGVDVYDDWYVNTLTIDEFLIERMHRGETFNKIEKPSFTEVAAPFQSITDARFYKFHRPGDCYGIMLMIE